MSFREEAIRSASDRDLGTSLFPVPWSLYPTSMRIDILTLFPGMFVGPFAKSIIGRAVGQGIVSIAIHDIRAYAEGRHRVVDDYPYGGGPGMVMKPGPIAAALDAVAALAPERGPVVLLTPQGRRFDQGIAREYARAARLTLLCGRYEGVDERVRGLVSDELSLGDFVLSGGEPAAIVVVDAEGICRYIDVHTLREVPDEEEIAEELKKLD